MASINSIQVKEYIQALTDENQVRVEKIGSGNWYWSFGSDEKRERERQLDRAKTEVGKARKSCADAEALLAAETTRRQEETDDEGRDGERQILLAKKADLEASVGRLRQTVTQSEDSVSRKSVQQLQREVAGFREEAMQWTDNIYILEEYLRRLAGGDREVVASVLRECYGEEYVEGEGLAELE